MIRLARSEDVPRIVELGSRSLVDGPYKGIIDDNPEQTYKLALQIIHGGGRILLSEEEGKINGLFGMLLVAHPFTNRLTADELIWYVEPETRAGGDGIKLLWEAERIAKQFGAKDIQVSSPNEQVGAIYRRFGFKQIEVKYLKELR